jgi:hypothetical protein
MTIGSPKSFRGGQGIVDWLFIVLIAAAVIAVILIWRS